MKERHTQWLDHQHNQVSSENVLAFYHLFINLKPSSIDYNLWTASNVLQGSRHIKQM